MTTIQQRRASRTVNDSTHHAALLRLSTGLAAAIAGVGPMFWQNLQFALALVAGFSGAVVGVITAINAIDDLKEKRRARREGRTASRQSMPGIIIPEPRELSEFEDEQRHRHRHDR